MNISLNNSGGLSVESENELTSLMGSFDAEQFGGADFYKNKIKEIALSVKSGNISVTTNYAYGNKGSFTFAVTSDDLLPDEPNVNDTITVALTFEIEFKNNSFNSNFNFDGKSVAVAVGIAGVILAILFLISTGGLGGLVAAFSSLIVSGQALIH